MSSVLHYKFKTSLNEWDQLHFDGTVLSTLDVKRAIIITKKLTRATSGTCEFDLLLTNAQTGEGRY